VSAVNFKNDVLRKLIAAIKDPPKVRVGIFGDENARKGVEVTNAEIGAKHEYGQDGMPVRSFLRMPLTEKLQPYLDKSKAFTPEAMKKVNEDASIAPWLEKVGVVAEQVVAAAFNTGGFGKWKPSNMEKKKVKQTLIETQQLRNSIVSKVVK
jgi:hypothetical protein